MQDGTWIASRAYDTPSTRTRCADIRKRFETVLDDLKCDGDDDSSYTPRRNTIQRAQARH